MDNVKQCIFCNNFKIIFERKVISPINSKIYSLFKCEKCGISFFTPLIFENIYSGGEFYTKRYDMSMLYSWNDFVSKFFKKKKINLKNKKILDIGASNCVNFLALKKYHEINSENYYALELDKKALAVGKKAGVKNIIPHYFDKTILKKIKIQFDIIIATEVFEHQVNPKEFMETAFDLLKKDGLLVLTVPNKDRFFMKQREMPADVPPHHFLKLSKKFFIKSFKKNLIHLEDFHNRQSTTKSTSQSLSKLILKKEKYWPLFVPIIPLIRLGQILDNIIGDKLLIILKKN